MGGEGFQLSDPSFEGLGSEQRQTSIASEPPTQDQDRIAERNRRAQKRFREREKARKEASQQQLVDLSAQLRAAKEAAAELEKRNSLLEQVRDVPYQGLASPWQ